MHIEKLNARGNKTLTIGPSDIKMESESESDSDSDADPEDLEKK